VEVLDGLGQTMLWLGDEAAAVELRTKAFRAYRQRGDVEAAANIGVYLAAVVSCGCTATTKHHNSRNPPGDGERSLRMRQLSTSRPVESESVSPRRAR